MSFIRSIGAFAIGAAVGAIGSYIYLKRKFEKELDERVSAIKNTMDKMREAEEKEREESNSSLEKLKAEAAVFHEGDEEETEDDRKIREEFIKKIHDENYDYDYDYDLEEPVEMDEHGDPIDKEEVTASRYMDIISNYDGSENVYLVTEDDFENNIYGHAQKFYLYFDKSPDDKVHVMEEDGEEIEESRWKDELGYFIWAKEPSLFDYYSTHDIYIRNEDIATDFLIHKSELEWIPGEGD